MAQPTARSDNPPHSRRTGDELPYCLASSRTAPAQCIPTIDLPCYRVSVPNVRSISHCQSTSFAASPVVWGRGWHYATRAQEIPRIADELETGRATARSRRTLPSRTVPQQAACHTAGLSFQTRAQTHTVHRLPLAASPAAWGSRWHYLTRCQEMMRRADALETGRHTVRSRCALPTRNVSQHDACHATGLVCQTRAQPHTARLLRWLPAPWPGEVDGITQREIRNCCAEPPRWRQVAIRSDPPRTANAQRIPTRCLPCSRVSMPNPHSHSHSPSTSPAYRHVAWGSRWHSPPQEHATLRVADALANVTPSRCQATPMRTITEAEPNQAKEKPCRNQAAPKPRQAEAKPRLTQTIPS